MFVCKNCGNVDYDYINFKKKIIICSKCKKENELQEG